jgi:hypothetical protein
LVPAVPRAASDTNSPAAAPKKNGTIPFHGAVTAVDKNAETFTIGKQTSQTYYITSSTKITNATNNAPATVSDITVGEMVGGVYTKDASGKMNARTLHIGTKAGKATKPAKKKKATTTDGTSTNSVPN